MVDYRIGDLCSDRWDPYEREIAACAVLNLFQEYPIHTANASASEQVNSSFSMSGKINLNHLS